MQYLLTQEEKDGLTPIDRVSRRDNVLEKLRVAILRVTGKLCIHDHKENGRRVGGYCSECPLDAFSHGPHAWGDAPATSMGLDHDESKLVCKLSRSYGQ